MAATKTVLLINQYFYPDMAATSQLLGDLARHLGSSGWNVLALAGRGHYAKAADIEKSRLQVLWPGVSVHRVWCTDFGRGNYLGRLCDYITFLVSASAAVVLSPRRDIVVCLSTPPLVAVLGLLAQLKGSRLVYKVEDIYPEVAVALSTLRPKSLLTQSLSWISRFLLSKANGVIALDKAMAERLLHAGAQSVQVIPNWADGTAIRPDTQARRSFRERESLEGKFVVLYSGNLGLAHRFDAVLHAAKLCVEECPDVLFLFVGNGPRLNSVKGAAAGLSNVRFMGYQPRERLNELYNAADIHLVTLQDEAAGLLFPSKYPAALAAGKPVLLVGGSSAPFATEIRTQKLGWVCPHRSASIMDALSDAQKNSTNLEVMGKSARRLFETRYSRTIAMELWGQVLETVMKVSLVEEDSAIKARSA